MRKFLTGKWSFWIGALYVALLINLGLYLFDAPLGMTEAYRYLSGYCFSALSNGKLESPSGIDWRTGFLLGVFGGGLLAALMTGMWKFQAKPSGCGKGVSGYLLGMCRDIGGGFLVMFGLLISGDDFLGQWASAMQLSPGAWVFMVALFISGSMTAIMMARRAGGKEG